MNRYLLTTALFGSLLLGGQSMAAPVCMNKTMTQLEAGEVLYRAEFEIRQRMRFQALDRDADGVLSRDERRAACQQAKDRKADEAGTPRKMHDQYRARDRKPDRAGHPPGHDGALTEEMFVQRALARFDRLDRDSDGMLTAEDIEASRSHCLRDGMRGTRRH